MELQVCKDPLLTVVLRGISAYSTSDAFKDQIYERALDVLTQMNVTQ